MFRESFTDELPTRSRVLRQLLLIELAAAAVLYVVFTWHWMLICDSPIMHYVNFLVAHGLKPYSEITDNNLPGSYLSEALGTHLFGAGDLGWRLYEFFLLGTLTTAMAVIAAPYDWAAGVFAGGMFLLMHGQEGPWFAGERELTMSALVLVGYAALFLAVRHRSPAWMLPMGFCTAFAASIKPTVVLLGPLLLVAVAIVLRKRNVPRPRYVISGLAGMAVAVALNLGYLFQHHAFQDFLTAQRTITPYYAALAKLSFSKLVLYLLRPRPFLVLPLAGFVLTFSARRWTWEKWALAFGAGVGLLSYFEQRKGFLHHRYMLFLFLFLLVGLELMRGLQRKGWQQWVSIAALAWCMLMIVPYDLHATYRVKGDSDLALQLESDLSRLATRGDLQRKVQCLDLVYGCFNALYHLQLVGNTGFTGDLLIFDPAGGSAVRAHRATWWRLAHTAPADVLVMTNEQFQTGNGYGKLDNWPEYQDYVRANYVLLTGRSFQTETGTRVSDTSLANGYRIYVRKGSPFEQVDLGPA